MRLPETTLPDMDTEGMLEAAVQVHADGDLERAESLYQEILDQAPGCVEALRLLAAACHQLGRTDESLGLLEAAISQFPSNARLYISLGDLRRSRDDVDGALTAYQKAAELAGDTDEASVFHLANVLQQMNCPAEAGRLLRKLAESQPGNARAYEELGVLYHEQGDLAAALAVYLQALDLEPDNVQTHYNLGNLHLAQARLEDAAQHYRRAIDCQPDCAPVWHNLGIVYQKQERFGKACQAYEQAAALDPTDADIYLQLGHLHLQQLDATAAEAAYQQVIELQPDHGEVYRLLAGAQDAQGKWALAEASYQRALEYEPDDVQLLVDLGTTQRAQRKLAEAVNTYRRGLTLEPAHAGIRSALVESLRGLGRDQEAIETLVEWKQIDPENAIAQHLLPSHTGDDVPERASDEYVRTLFDHLAPHFDEHLGSLGYSGPDLLAETLTQHGFQPDRQLEVLDAGCGTGLCGVVLRPYTRNLVGVDLSSAMLHRAREREVYDALVQAELTSFLEGNAEAYDLITAADVLVYFGDLQPFMAAAAAALRSDGSLFFITELADDGSHGQGYHLSPHGRYSHTREYVEQTVANAGLRLESINLGNLRMHRGEPALALFALARK